MATWTTPPVWPNAPTGVTLTYLLKHADNLQYLKDGVEAARLEIDNLAPAPTTRAATLVSGSTWATGRAYTAGRIVVFVNGLLRRKGSGTGINAWYESDPANGQITFNNITPPSDAKILVWDWTP